MNDPVSFPLSAGQQRNWFFHELAGEGHVVSDYRVVRIVGPLDVRALRTAAGRVVARHEPLRTAFADFAQHVHPAGELPVRVVDVASEAAALDAARNELSVPFDVARPPLARVVLYQLTPQDFVLLLYFHLLIVDAWAVEVFCRDLSAYYREPTTGVPAELPILRIQPGEWSARQADRRWDLGWWVEKLRDVREPIALPLRPGRRPARPAPRRLFRPLGTLRPGVAAFAKERRVSPFVVFLAAYTLVLREHSGQKTFVILTPYANREEPGTHDVMGFFVEMLPLKVEFDGEPSDVVAAASQMLLEAYEHSGVPLQRLARLGGPRSPGRTPLAQVGIAYRPEGSIGTLTFPGCEVSDVHLDADRAKFELTLRINEDDAETYVCAEFDACLYTDEYINDLLDDYLAVLADFVPSSHEDAVASAFADVLGVPVDRDADFFALGGDSAQLLHVLLRLRAEFGDRVDLRSLYDDPVVRRVAHRLPHHDPHS